MTKEIPPIEAKTEGTTRILKIGNLAINVDNAAPAQKLEYPPGILFDFDALLTDFIVFFDSIDSSDNSPLRDALLMMRSQLAAQPEVMVTFQKLCAKHVVIDHNEFALIPRRLFEKMSGVVDEVARSAHQIDQTNPALYVGDDLE